MGIPNRSVGPPDTGQLVMRAEHLIWAYVVGALSIIGALALFEEYRRRSFNPPRAPDVVFRCRQCALVYTDDPGVERSRCPGCGRTNEPYDFR